ncbi:MAG: hypothetical protein H6822_13165 [Planctomycetaceae bacterium]|nr:hypothetical protein [Planctomycetales bacterium]MCB9923128.1 hypothetical protein [Planctomycetaceae bacterium]
MIAPVRIFVVTYALALMTHTAIADEVRIATFKVDATPAIGTPVAYAPVREILDPLSARGLVLLGADNPVVLCAVDWIGIANDGYDAWRTKLAEAAGTTPDHVAVHTLHQHDGARCDFDTERLLAERGLGGRHFDNGFLHKTIDAAAAAIREALKHPTTVTHIGVGKARVEKVASNRRILGDDGKVQIVRWSKTTDPAAIAAPEGTIDPYLRLISFWNDQTPIASLTYYTTHPQSYYGDGDVTSEFIGLGRAAREQSLPDVAHIHFNGASGNVTAGKYNDGSHEMRPILASRIERGMQQAWEATAKHPITVADVEWRVESVKLPAAAHLDEAKLTALLDDDKTPAATRLNAASHLAWLKRNRSGMKIDTSCLRIGNVYVVHMPGELFVEYQLAAQAMRPDDTVCMAAYGDYGPGYIGTEIAYGQGGYETSERASRVAPQVEGVLTKALQTLLR